MHSHLPVYDLAEGCVYTMSSRFYKKYCVKKVSLDDTKENAAVRVRFKKFNMFTSVI